MARQAESGGLMLSSMERAIVRMCGLPSIREGIRRRRLFGVQHTSRPFFVHVESLCPDTHPLLAFVSSELPYKQCEFQGECRILVSVHTMTGTTHVAMREEDDFLETHKV